MTLHYPHHIGIRLTAAEYADLKTLIAVSGHNRSTIIRFLIRTASQRPEAVAMGLRRDLVKQHEA